jgi:O-antigen/teichoic acid export membrane protein
MIGISILYFIFANEIINYLYGDRYLGAGNILRYYGFCIIPIALSFLIENYLIAIRKIMFVWIIAILSPIQFILIYKIYHTPNEILSVTFIFGGGILLSGIIILFKIIHKERSTNGRFDISNTTNI